MFGTHLTQFILAAHQKMSYENNKTVAYPCTSEKWILTEKQQEGKNSEKLFQLDIFNSCNLFYRVFSWSLLKTESAEKFVINCNNVNVLAAVISGRTSCKNKKYLICLRD